jgi:hypothetical protein
VGSAKLGEAVEPARIVNPASQPNQAKTFTQQRFAKYRG